jgi:hypothetical protein
VTLPESCLATAKAKCRSNQIKQDRLDLIGSHDYYQ